jgi:predicted hotdog family 3-hydroxylacyl-ACP dehydratase
VLTAPLGRDDICRLVPHQGAMCLLDRALSWDAERILCETDRHAWPGNPLRRDGMLPAACGLEFAFQAMALHGALSAAAGAAAGASPPRAQPPGFVGALKEVRIAVERLDVIAGPLRILAEALVLDTRGSVYRFEVSAREGGRGLLAGQATVVVPEAPEA